MLEEDVSSLKDTPSMTEDAPPDDWRIVELMICGFALVGGYICLDSSL